MNERINDLASQAKFMAEEELNRQISYNAELKAFAEKFAELIVRECALTLESITVFVLDYNPDFDNGYNKALITGAGVIKKHFGVE